MARKHKFAGLARRLKNAGLKVHGSDRSETIYVAIGDCELRISGHELGVADYGTRQQRHRGPEVVMQLDDLAAVLDECIFQARQWVRDFAGHWTAGRRSQAAAAFCSLRRIAAKVSK